MTNMYLPNKKLRTKVVTAPDLSYLEIPANSAFSINFDPEKQCAILSLHKNPRANAHYKNGVECNSYTTVEATIANKTDAEAVSILPVRMLESTTTNLAIQSAPNYLSSVNICDCIVVVLYDENSQIANMTHYFTQNINPEILRSQVQTLISEGGALQSMKAKVVGGHRDSLWASFGFFRCIEPLLDELSIEITETDLGQGHQIRILFDVQNSRLLKLNFTRQKSHNKELWLDKRYVDYDNEDHRRLNWATECSECSYYGSSYKDEDLFVFARLKFQEE